MIARIRFEGIVKDGKKKSVLPDHVDLHVPPGDSKYPETIFRGWIEDPRALGIRGDSGVFHPLRHYGEIKILGVFELDAVGDEIPFLAPPVQEVLPPKPEKAETPKTQVKRKK